MFANTLERAILEYASDVNPLLLIIAGPTHVQEVVPAAQIPGVLMAYNKSITTVFVMPIAVTVLAFCASFLFEWKSVKGKNLLAAVG